MRKPLAFITGIAGFVGSFLAEELLRSGYRVAGSIYNDEPTNNIDTIKKQLSLYSLDIVEQSRCRRLLKRLQPDYLFHLAAFASVGRSFANERATYKVNFDGTLNILEAAREVTKLRKLIFVTSADTYGTFTPPGKLLTEKQQLNPVSPYGISKAYAEQLCLYHQRRHGTPVVVARAFNHAGPRQDENFVIPAFAKQIASIEAGQQKPEIQVGNLSARRDLSDVRDIVGGYRLLARKGKPGQSYQFCSGRTYTISKVLELLLKLSPATIKVKTDRSRLRKNDIPILRGSNRKAVQELGFATRYKLRETLTDTLNYWREKISG